MSPTLKDALQDSLGEAVMVCDMAKPCKFLSLDSCQKRFQWTHKEVDLAPHPVADLVLMHLESKAWIFFFFFFSQQAGSM